MILKCLVPLLILAPFCVGAAEYNEAGLRHAPLADAAEGRLLVRFRAPDGNAATTLSKPSSDRITSLSGRAKIGLRTMRDIGAGIQLVEVQDKNQSLEAIAAQLRSDAEVEFVSLDRRRFAHAVPNDSLFAGQWYLQSAQTAAIRADSAWDVTKGSSGVVIAVLDTGVRFEHPDLGRGAQGGKLLPGYDFVSSEGNGGFLVANDGSGWDADPSDPGDWINSADTAKAQFKGCTVSDSSWHGTRTSGIIGALSNNGTGITGINWNAWLLPVRVLGKCGGFDSDIIAGMRWAAGLHVSGVPDNPYPAKILNMSLGNQDTTQCQTYQPVVNELRSRGVLIVVSAGNEGGPVDEPADCNGVLGVAGLRHAGTKVGYSNLGRQIGISAPAGNCGTSNGGPCLFSLDTTTDKGLTAATGSSYTNQTNFNLGTSFSAPIASGVTGLMLAVNGKLDPTLLIERLGRGARAFPTPLVDSSGAPLPTCHLPASPTDIQNSECVCTTAVCGAGVLDAAGAVQEALRPIASIRASGVVSAGASLSFDAGASSAACGRTISAYAWTAVDGNGQPVALTSTNQSTTSVLAPASGTVTVTLVITDSSGGTDSGSVPLTATAAGLFGPAATTTPVCPQAITVTPTSTGGSGGTTTPAKSSGGGGALDLWSLLCGGAVAMRRRSRRHRLQCRA